jgi:hypothetical protein
MSNLARKKPGQAAKATFALSLPFEVKTGVLQNSAYFEVKQLIINKLMIDLACGKL